MEAPEVLRTELEDRLLWKSGMRPRLAKNSPNMSIIAQQEGVASQLLSHLHHDLNSNYQIHPCERQAQPRRLFPRLRHDARVEQFDLYIRSVYSYRHLCSSVNHPATER